MTIRHEQCDGGGVSVGTGSKRTAARRRPGDAMKLERRRTRAPVRGLPDLAARLEAAGCDGLYFAEIAHDPFLPVAAAAHATSRMKLGTSIALAFPRSPTSLVYTAHDLVEATGGRSFWIGSQVSAHIERRFGLTWTDPVQRMREVVLAMRAVWDCWARRRPIAVRRRNLSAVADAACIPGRSRHPIRRRRSISPPSVQRWRRWPASRRRAVIHAFSTPAYVRTVILPAVEERLRRSGRSRADFQLCYSAFLADAAVGLEQAREQARGALAFYASTPDYKRVLDLHGIGDLQPKLRAMTREGAWRGWPAKSAMTCSTCSALRATR